MMFPKPGKRKKGTSRKKSPGTLIEYARQHPVCEICGRNWSAPHAIAGGVHHIRPRGRGGPDSDENLISLCSEHHTAAHMGMISESQLLEAKG